MRAHDAPRRVLALLLALLFAACSRDLRAGASPSVSPVPAAGPSEPPAGSNAAVTTARRPVEPATRSTVIEGLVVSDETGEPIADAEVRVEPMASRGEGSVVRSDRFGRFAVPVDAAATGTAGGRPGALRLEVRARNFALLSEHFLDGARPVCRLVVGACVRGRVVDSRGQPVAGAEVLLLATGPDRVGVLPDLSPPRHRARSAGDGSFAIENVCAGEFLLATWSAGPPERIQKPASGVYVSLEAGSVARVELVLE